MTPAKAHYLFLILLLMACTTTPITGSKKLIFTSRQQENAMGEKAFKEIIQKEKIDENSLLAKQVHEIGKRLAISADRPDFKWEFKVFQGKQINAFCLPGGKIGFYAGMAKVANTPDRIAAVLAHEIGHALARHGGQRLTAHLGQEILIGVLAATTLSELQNDKRDLTIAALGLATSVGLILPFSRDNESEADEIGIMLMSAAGFNPAEAITLWERMETMTGTSGPTFLSTHPSHSKRQEKLKTLLPRAQAIYMRKN